MYVDDHPLVLNLDIDRERFMIGGWRDRLSEGGRLARQLALEMAKAHLRAGHDVIVPQFVGRVSEVERFEAAATDSRADFREIVLMDNKEGALDRFSRRGEGQSLPSSGHVLELAKRYGGSDAGAEMYDRLIDVLQHRPTATVIRSDAGEIQATYEELSRALPGS